MVGFPAWGPPAGPVARVCQPASLNMPVGSGSSAERLRVSQMFLLSGPSGDENRDWIITRDVKYRKLYRRRFIVPDYFRHLELFLA